jgi:hypothetical protein
MRTPFKVSLVASVGVFLTALVVSLFHLDSINGHVLTPAEEMPQALALATLAGTLALLGAWLGLRHTNPRCLTDRLGHGIALVYVMATWLADAVTTGPPQTFVIPSREFEIEGVKVLLLGALWGIGAPWLIAAVLKRLKWFQTSDG